jgi:hypothetical protein
MPVIPWVCTPLYILFSYTSCQLNSSFSLVSFTEPFWAQKAFGGGEGEARYRPAPSHVYLYHVGVEDAHRSLPYHLCHPRKPPQHLSNLHQSLPKNQPHLHPLRTERLQLRLLPRQPLRRVGRRRRGRLPHPLHLVFVVLQNLLAAGPASRRLRRQYHRLVAFSQHS